ncbi:MAG: alpha/beta hydrolase [Armatimonadaceae bacterium]
MPTARIGDLEVYYEVHGEAGEERPLLLIAGLGADITEWGSVVPERLSEKRQVILFDNRGAGRTTQPRGPYTMPQLARDAVGVLDYLHVDTADVVGVSMGGMIAQYVALDYPMRVGKLILGCTMAGRGNFRIPHLRALLNMTRKKSGDPFEDYWRNSLPNAYTREFIVANRELLENHVRNRLLYPACAEAKDAQIRAIVYTHNAYYRLSTLTKPTLVIAGTRDAFIPPENSTIIAETIPGAQLHLIPGAGHVFWISHPEETLHAWQTFLDAPDSVPVTVPARVSSDTEPEDDGLGEDNNPANGISEDANSAPIPGIMNPATASHV